MLKSAIAVLGLATSHFFVTPVFAGVVATNVCNTAACKDQASIMLSKIDQHGDPCTDLYQFSCGGWIENATIPDGHGMAYPPDFKSKGDFYYPTEMLMSDFKDDSNPIWPQIKTFFNSCMDFSKRKEAGVKPIKPYLDQLLKFLPENTTGENTLTDALIYITNWRMKNLVNGAILGQEVRFFEAWSLHGSRADLKTSISALLKAVLGDRAMQWHETVNYDEIALQIVQLDRLLDKAHRGKDKVPYRSNSVDDLGGGLFDMKKFLQSMPVTNSGEVTVTIPYKTYYSDLWAVLKSQPMKTVRYYLIFKYIDGLAWALGEDKYVGLVSHVYLMWLTTPAVTSTQYCVSSTMAAYDFAMRPSFARYMDITPADMTRLKEMYAAMKEKLLTKLPGMKWLTEFQVNRAKILLEKMKVIPATPAILLDPKFLTKYYARLPEATGNYFDNVVATGKFLQYVDANYDDLEMLWWPSVGFNELYKKNLLISAAQFYTLDFSSKDPAAVQYASIGVSMMQSAIFQVFTAIIYQFTAVKMPEYKKIVHCNVNQYSKFKIPELNTPVKGEDFTDWYFLLNTALELAYEAWKDETANDKPLSLPGLQQYTQEQLFFIRHGQLRCQKGTAKYNKMFTKGWLAPNAMVGGAAINTEAYAQVFQCKVGMPMNPAQKCSFL